MCAVGEFVVKISCRTLGPFDGGKRSIMVTLFTSRKGKYTVHWATWVCYEGETQHVEKHGPAEIDGFIELIAFVQGLLIGADAGHVNAATELMPFIYDEGDNAST